MSLSEYVKKQKFAPGLLGVFINPFFFARQGLLHKMRVYAKKIGGDILDVGCGKKPYKYLFDFHTYIGMDIENPGHDHANEDIDVFYDGTTFPFEKESFDSVLANQVLEHVFNPDVFLSEINRVLKRGGRVLITVPFIWDEHEQPYDYGRYSSFGLKHILEKQGFTVLEHAKTVNDIRAVFQLFILFVYKKIVTKNKLVNIILTGLLIAPFNILGSVLSVISPRNNDFFLDNVILAEKK